MNTIREYLNSSVERLARSRPDSDDLRGRGYAYSSVAEWFAKHGREMPTTSGAWNEEERAIIEDLSERTRLRKGFCFANAQKVVFAAVASSRLEPDENLAYAEGYAWITGQRAPFAHGWCVLNGKVWDPSLDKITARGVTYFGNTFPTKYLVERILLSGRFGPLVNDWKRQWPLLKRPWRRPADLRAVVGDNTLRVEPALT